MGQGAREPVGERLEGELLAHVEGEVAPHLLAVLGESQGDTVDTKDLFDGFDPSKYEEEAKARWGNTDAHAESKKRAQRYTKEDWKNLEAEQSAIYAAAAAAMEAGKDPGSEEAMDIADRHRLSIDRWFYPCSVAFHERLAAMYEGDARFAENIDKHGAGLTTFLAEAIRANAARRGG